MNKPKKQHYVPRTYLNQFSIENGNIYIYDKVKQEIRLQNHINVGYNKHFYTVEIDGEKDYFIEEYLAENVDVLYPFLLAKISNNEELDSNDKSKLGLYLAAQHLRTPYQRKNYNNMVEKGTKKITQLIYSRQRNGNLLSEEMIKEEVAEIIEDGKYRVDVPKEHSLAFLISFVEEMAEMLAKQNVLILKSSKKSEFITSDNPYAMVKERWAADWSGYGIINTVKIFPFSPDYLIMLKDIGSKVIYLPSISSMDVRAYNQLIAMQSDRYIFGRNEKLIRSISAKLKNK